MILKLNHIFIPQADKLFYEKQELLGLKIQRSFMNRMANSFNITYQENSSGTTNLCFINNSEVRSEFKIIFTSTDIVYFVCAELKNDLLNIELDEVLLPSDLTCFWRLVEEGEKLKRL